MSADESCLEAQCEQPKSTDPGWNLTDPNDSEPTATPSKTQPKGRDLSGHSGSSSRTRRRIAEDVAASDASTQEKNICPPVVVIGIATFDVQKKIAKMERKS